MKTADSELAEVRACRVCADVLPLGPRPVVQVSKTARVLIASQAAGTKVHDSGFPFSGDEGACGQAACHLAGPEHRPDESISLQFEVQRRGPVVDLAAVKTDFQYDDWFPKEPNVGHETLIYDVIRAVTSVRP